MTTESSVLVSGPVGAGINFFGSLFLKEGNYLYDHITNEYQYTQHVFDSSEVIVYKNKKFEVVDLPKQDNVYIVHESTLDDIDLKYYILPDTEQAVQYCFNCFFIKRIANLTFQFSGDAFLWKDITIPRWDRIEKKKLKSFLDTYNYNSMHYHALMPLLYANEYFKLPFSKDTYSKFIQHLHSKCYENFKQLINKSNVHKDYKIIKVSDLLNNKIDVDEHINANADKINEYIKRNIELINFTEQLYNIKLL